MSNNPNETKSRLGAQQASPAEAAAPPKPAFMLVLDTTATADSVDPQSGRAIPGKRVHEQIIEGAVRPFTFEHGKGTPLPPEIAHKFLKHTAFRLVDAEGNPLPFERTPKQPEQLEAGEQFKLGPQETVARYSELSLEALQTRAFLLPGGEMLKGAPRSDLVKFIIAAREKTQKANTARPETSALEYTPEAEDQDDMAA